MFWNVGAHQDAWGLIGGRMVGHHIQRVLNQVVHDLSEQGGIALDQGQIRRQFGDQGALVDGMSIQGQNVVDQGVEL